MRRTYLRAFCKQPPDKSRNQPAVPVFYLPNLPIQILTNPVGAGCRRAAERELVVLAGGGAGCGAAREAPGTSLGSRDQAGGRRSKVELAAAVAWKCVRALVLSHRGFRHGQMDLEEEGRCGRGLRRSLARKPTAALRADQIPYNISWAVPRRKCY
jgi:hypothetical protein